MANNQIYVWSPNKINFVHAECTEGMSITIRKEIIYSHASSLSVKIPNEIRTTEKNNVGNNAIEEALEQIIDPISENLDDNKVLLMEEFRYGNKSYNELYYAIIGYHLFALVESKILNIDRELLLSIRESISRSNESLAEKGLYLTQSENISSEYHKLIEIYRNIMYGIIGIQSSKDYYLLMNSLLGSRLVDGTIYSEVHTKDIIDRYQKKK